MIKHTRTVTSDLEASNFFQRVYDLFGAYIHQKIIVGIIRSGDVILTEFEIKGMLEFDHLAGILRLNSYSISSTSLTCTVRVEK